MRKLQNWVTLFVCFVVGFWHSSLASIPPHPRVKKMIQEQTIAVPYYLQNRAELLQRGVNAPWSSPRIHQLKNKIQSQLERTLGPAASPTGSWKALGNFCQIF